MWKAREEEIEGTCKFATSCNPQMSTEPQALAAVAAGGIALVVANNLPGPLTSVPAPVYPYLLQHHRSQPAHLHGHQGVPAVRLPMLLCTCLCCCAPTYVAVRLRCTCQCAVA